MSRRPPAVRSPLTRDRIVVAAIELVDRDGLEALSMRKLGSSLGVEAMSLYNHVDNKGDVLDAMLDQVLRQIPLPAPELDWQDRFRQLAISFREAGTAHPGVLPLFASQAIRSVEGFAPLECAYDILRSAGLGPADALDAFVSSASFVLGYALTEIGGLRDVAEGNTIDFGSTDLAAHPRLAEMGNAFAQSDPDRQFELGLDLLIAGLTHLVARSAET